MKTLIKVILIALILTPICAHAEDKNIDVFEYLMRSTFKIQGENSFGTAFVMGMPAPTTSRAACYVLITATHVLKSIKSDHATIFLRKKVGENYEKYPYEFKIRDQGKPMWINHDDVDVAAIMLPIPDDAEFPLISTELLATDEMLHQYEVHPGDQLFVLGYPYGAEANEAGFPILRSGRIASFPLSPTSQYKTFLLDFEVFAGNSGGPVLFYSENRLINDKVKYNKVQFIMGVVSLELSKNEEVSSLTEKVVRKLKLSLAVIAQARFVNDLIEEISYSLESTSKIYQPPGGQE